MTAVRAGVHVYEVQSLHATSLRAHRCSDGDAVQLPPVLVGALQGYLFDSSWGIDCSFHSLVVKQRALVSVTTMWRIDTPFPLLRAPRVESCQSDRARDDDVSSGGLRR